MDSEEATLLIQKDFVASTLPDVERYGALQNLKQYQCAIMQISGPNGEPIEDVEIYGLFLNELQTVTKWCITAEYNKDQIFHGHVMLQTSQRSDAIRRTMTSTWTNLTIHDTFRKRWGQDCTMDCLKLQRCQKPSSLYAYMTKNPLWILSNSENTLQYLYDINHWELNAKYKTEEPKDPDLNKMTEELIQVIMQSNCKSIEDMMKAAPETMVKYLHRPGLMQVVNNCIAWVKSTCGSWSLSMFQKYDIDPETIHKTLLHQGIRPCDFDKAFHTWITKSDPKKNTIVLYGPSNTGKSAFISGFKQIVPWGEIQNTQTFAFEGLIDTKFGIWEEPLVSPELAEKCKQVFEGMQTSIPIKYRKPQLLPRTPILITTNHPVWRFCSAEQEAFENRMVIFDFNYTCKDTFYCPRTSEPSCECRYCCGSRGGSPAISSSESSRMPSSEQPISSEQSSRTNTESEMGSGSMSDPGEGTSSLHDSTSRSSSISTTERSTNRSGSIVSSSSTTNRHMEPGGKRIGSSDPNIRKRSAESDYVVHVESTKHTRYDGSDSDGIRSTGERSNRRGDSDAARHDTRKHSNIQQLGLMEVSSKQKKEISIPTKKRKLDRQLGAKVGAIKLDMFIPLPQDWKTYLNYLYHMYG